MRLAIKSELYNYLYIIVYFDITEYEIIIEHIKKY